MTDIAASGVVIERGLGTRAWSRGRRYRGVVVAYVLLLPSLIALGLFTYGPIVQVGWDSLHLQRSPGAAPTFAGSRNFEAVFADAAFRNALVNNLVYAFGSVVPSLIIALGLALALARSIRINSPDKRPLTVGLAAFTRGQEGAQAWGVIAAGTLLVVAPLLIGFLVFQRRFVNSFVTSGIK